MSTRREDPKNRRKVSGKKAAEKTTSKKIVSLKAAPKKDMPVRSTNKSVGEKSMSQKADPHVDRLVDSLVEYDEAARDLPRPLTLKEKNVLEFIEGFVRENGISPSYQEICRHFGFASFNSVQRYLKQLETKGYIRVPGGNQKRALTLLRSASAFQETLEELQREAQENVRNVTPLPPNVQSSFQNEVFNLPLLGRVAAGAPIEAYEHDEYIDVPASLVRHADRTYALRVQGQSMIDDGILDGDVILVQRQAHATNGEIVVAMIGEEATVKRFYTHNTDPRDSDYEGETFGSRKMIELRPANSNMTSLWFSPEEVQLRGVVVGLIRKF